MILIADAGSTKTQWIVLTPTGNADFSLVTSGINAALMSDAQIADTLRLEVAPHIHEQVSEIWWYGAGCAGRQRCQEVERAIAEALDCDTVHVDTDMMCAARALCGHQPGIACILGTGSNSCLFDGATIVDNVPPLGFILGDEGSGAVLGRRVISDLFKRRLPEDICTDFSNQYHLTISQVIESVYRSPMPSRFLAQFAPFIKHHIHRPEIEAIVIDSFCQFLQRNVMNYSDWQLLPINFTGSIAAHFRPQLTRACDICGCRLGTIVAAPAEEIAKYHLAK